MDLQLEEPNLTDFSVCIELRVGIMAQVLEHAQITPPARSCVFVSSAGDLYETVDGEIELLLFDQPVIYTGNGLLARLSGRGIGQDVALKPIMVRILAGQANIAEGSHERQSSDEVFGERGADAASIRNTQSSHDLVV